MNTIIYLLLSCTDTFRTLPILFVSLNRKIIFTSNDKCANRVKHVRSVRLCCCIWLGMLISYSFIDSRRCMVKAAADNSVRKWCVAIVVFQITQYCFEKGNLRANTLISKFITKIRLVLNRFLNYIFIIHWFNVTLCYNNACCSH